MRIILVGILMSTGVLAVPAEDGKNPALRWEPAIAAFEAEDKAHPVEPGGILFLGSSSIRMWDLAQWFPEVPAINRGFGGSQISDSLYYFDRLVTPYAPSTIVFYAGDNDVAGGKTAETVAADFQTFTQKVWTVLPETRILYIPIKPSTARWMLYPEMKKANVAIRAQAEGEERLVYIDIESHMLGDDGTPRKDLLLKDGLHMTPEGYRIWTDLVMPHLVGARAAK